MKTYNYVGGRQVAVGDIACFKAASENTPTGEQYWCAVLVADEDGSPVPHLHAGDETRSVLKRALESGEATYAGKL